MAVDRAMRAAIFERDKWTCRGCGWIAPRDARRIPFPKGFGRRLTLDHIVPRSEGGATSRTNLQAMCGRCNQDKSSKTDAEAATERKRYLLFSLKALLPTLEGEDHVALTRVIAAVQRTLINEWMGDPSRALPDSE